MQIESNPSLTQIRVPTVPIERSETSIGEASPQPTPSPPPTTVALGEIEAPSPVVTSNHESQTDVAALKSDSVPGAGKLPAKLASTLYVLNHSFDLQKQALDLLI